MSRGSLAARLKQLRTEKDVTTVVVAKAIGVTPSYITLLENGDRDNPSARVLNRIARYFSVHPAWLETGEVPRGTDLPSPPSNPMPDELGRRLDEIETTIMIDSDRENERLNAVFQYVVDTLKVAVDAPGELTPRQKRALLRFVREFASPAEPR